MVDVIMVRYILLLDFPNSQKLVFSCAVWSFFSKGQRAKVAEAGRRRRRAIPRVPLLSGGAALARVRRTRAPSEARPAEVRDSTRPGECRARRT